MTANKRRANAPVEVRVTMTDSLFTAAQNACIRNINDKVVESCERLLADVTEAGEKLSEFFTGHPLEDRARRAVLEPFERECVALVTRLNRISARLQVVMPPMSVEQFLANIATQLADIGEPAQPSPTANRSPAEKEPEELRHIVSDARGALTLCAVTMEEVSHAMDRKRRSNGTLSADDNAIADNIKCAIKKTSDVTRAIDALRRQQAERGARR